MTREEVIETVGGPPGDYADGRSLTYVICQCGRIHDPRRFWAAEDAVLSVEFNDDHDGRAVAVQVHDSVLIDRPPTPLLDRLRARLGL